MLHLRDLALVFDCQLVLLLVRNFVIGMQVDFQLNVFYLIGRYLVHLFYIQIPHRTNSDTSAGANHMQMFIWKILIPLLELVHADDIELFNEVKLFVSLMLSCFYVAFSSLKLIFWV